MPEQKLRLQIAPELKQELKLKPALVLQQALFQNLLSLSNDEAVEELLQYLADNPYLEEATPADSDTEDADTETTVELSSEESPESLHSEDSAADDLLRDPFVFHTMFWQLQPSSPADGASEDDDEEPYLPEAPQSFHEELLQQVSLMPLSEEERILAEEIIGSIDPDGYLREELSSIVKQANARIAELNTERAAQLSHSDEHHNPARRYALDPIVANRVLHRELPSPRLLQPLTLKDAERLLRFLQRELEPPGIGARTLQECLLAQLEARPLTTEAERWAYRIVKESFADLRRRTWREILKRFGGELTPDMLQQALEVIRHLNPRPGAGTRPELPLERTPDFTVTRDPETGELTITLNDNALPTLRINHLLSKLRRLPRNSPWRKLAPKDRQDLRNKYATANALLSVLRHRKETLLRIMTAIVKLQREFFEQGPQHLKPMIYADVARETGLDTSTICRAVANKSVLTDFGVFALKDLFTEGLPSTEGEEAVSVEVVKQKLRELLETEDPQNPLSDNQLAQKLKEMGYSIARRTVAKYREEMGFPPMWKRKALQ